MRQNRGSQCSPSFLRRRLVPLLTLFLACLLNAACVSLHADLFRSRLPSDPLSLHSVLTAPAPGQSRTEVSRSVKDFIPQVPMLRMVEDTLLVHSPLDMALKDTTKTVDCLRKEAGLTAEIATAKERVQRLNLRLGHFKDFLNHLVKLHEPKRPGSNLGPLLLSLQVGPPKDRTQLSFLHFLGGYLAAYTNGKFVDRDGTQFSKPGIDSSKHTISNDTITAFVSVVGEAIIDDFFYRHRSCLKFPIVVAPDTEPGTLKWLTAGDGVPTFARVLGLSEGSSPGDITDELKGLVELAPKADDETGGIGPKKLKLIRLAGGVAGDEGKLVSGLIVRNFGGLHFGQFALGKWSIGDNETLSKVAETVFELLAKRTNQSVASQALYARKFPDDLNWIVGIVEKLAGTTSASK